MEALGHKEVILPEIEPTCSKGGVTEGKYCEVCKETLVERFAISQLPHDYYDVAGLEPTCESSGWTQYKVCNECGHKDGYEVLDKLRHIDKAISRVYPTCTEAGIEKYIICELCGTYIIEPVVIPALGHAYVDGKCVRCAESDPNYKCQHKWGEWELVQEPTCQNEGEDIRICLLCGEKDTKYSPIADHWMIKIKIIDPTCTEDGFIERECNWCKMLTQEHPKSLGHYFVDGICGRCKEKDPNYECKHEWSPWEVQVKPICNVDGLEVRYCYNCKIEEHNTIPKLIHLYNTLAYVPATCITDGYEDLRCLHCGDTYRENIAALGHKFENGICINGCGMTEGCKEHKWSPWEVQVKPICNVDGLEVRYCYNCKIEEHNTIPKLIHLYNTLAYVPATCITDGYEDLRCSYCGDTYREYIAARGHDFRDGKCTMCGEYERICTEHVWGVWELLAKPTCQIEGKEVRRCQNCYKEEYKYIPMTNHNFIRTKIVEPTCTANGLIESECMNCTVRTQEYTPMISHNFVIRNHVAATCTEDGFDELYCTMCIETKVVVMMAYGHKYDGGKCLNCGELESGAVCKEHVWGEWKMHTMHTCYKDGVNVRYCQKCNMEDREVLPMLPHEFVTDKFVEATCTMDGYEEMRCKMCNELRKETFKAYGHSFDGGKCIRCGEAAPDIVCKEHNWSGWEVRVAPTCYKDGFEVRFCYNCKQEEQNFIPMIMHNFKVNKSVEPTCTTNGFVEEMCYMCGEMRWNDLPALAHYFVPGKFIAPTCVNPGYEEQSCINCKEVIRLDLAPIGHNFVDGKCTNCGELEPGAVCKEHVWGEWKMHTMHTCYKDGVNVRYCQKCNMEDREVLPMLPHEFVTDKFVEATCTMDGYEEMRCKMCNELRKETFKAYGHSFDGGKCIRCGEAEAGKECEKHVWGAIETLSPATCTTDGMARRVCKACGAETSLKIAKMGHQFVIVNENKPTCTEDGTREVVCATCGENQILVIPKLNHNVVDYVCIMCNEKFVIFDSGKWTA